MTLEDKNQQPIRERAGAEECVKGQIGWDPREIDGEKKTKLEEDGKRSMEKHNLVFITRALTRIVIIPKFQYWIPKKVTTRIPEMLGCFFLNLNKMKTKKTYKSHEPMFYSQ